MKPRSLSIPTELMDTHATLLSGKLRRLVRGYRRGLHTKAELIPLGAAEIADVYGRLISRLRTYTERRDLRFEDIGDLIVEEKDSAILGWRNICDDL